MKIESDNVHWPIGQVAEAVGTTAGELAATCEREGITASLCLGGVVYISQDDTAKLLAQYYERWRAVEKETGAKVGSFNGIAPKALQPNFATIVN